MMAMKKQEVAADGHHLLQPDTVGIQVALWRNDTDDSCFCTYVLLHRGGTEVNQIDSAWRFPSSTMEESVTESIPYADAQRHFTFPQLQGTASVFPMLLDHWLFSLQDLD